MTKLPRIAAGDVLRALRRDGWQVVRQSGSHMVLKHASKHGRVVVAYHSGAILKPKTLQVILERAGLTVEELRELL